MWFCVLRCRIKPEIFLALYKLWILLVDMLLPQAFLFKSSVGACVFWTIKPNSDKALSLGYKGIVQSLHQKWKSNWKSNCI